MKKLVIGLVIGLVLGGGGYAIAEDGDDIDPDVKSFDIGRKVPRIFAFCFGSDAVYQTGDSDGVAVAVNSTNCQQNGLLYNGES